MKHALLKARRDDVDLDLSADYWALFRGGKAFHERIERFLPQRPSEGKKHYDFRKSGAHYLNYAGPIVAFLAALVFSEKPEIVSEPKSADAFYGELQSDCDTLGTDLLDFMKERFTRALVTKRAWILVDFPRTPDGMPPANRADWERANLGRAYLTPLDDEQVVDWECDDRGDLEWVLVHQRDCRRRSIETPRGGVITDTWTLWGRDEWVRWSITYEKDKPPKDEDEIPEVGRGPVATKGRGDERGRVPLVRIELPEELWAMNIIADAQLEQTRKRNALSWGMDATCFVKPTYYLEEALPDEGAEDKAGGRGPTQGWGYAETLGVNEKKVWEGPPTGAFTVIAEYTAKLKDEIYRVVHQMALGVDNSAAAIGRSGESKLADASATAIVARAIGKLVTETIKRVLDLVSLGRGDPLAWSVGGMNKYVAVDQAAAVEAAAMFDTVNVPSPTARREAAKQVTFAYLRDLSPEQRDKIAGEIDKNITDEDAATPVNKTPAPGEEPEDDLDEDEKDEQDDEGETEDDAAAED